MFSYTFYDPADGRITETSQTSVEMDEANTFGRQYITGSFNSETHYVVSGEAVERPAMGCQLAGKTLSGIPAGSKLWINQTAYDVNDGVAELSCDQPAKIKVAVICFPYLPFVTEVDFAN